MTDIAVRIRVGDPQALWDKAKASYEEGFPGTDPAEILERIGTREEPKLMECAIEIIADVDHGGLFEFLD